MKFAFNVVTLVTSLVLCRWVTDGEAAGLPKLTASSSLPAV